MVYGLWFRVVKFCIMKLFKDFRDLSPITYQLSTINYQPIRKGMELKVHAFSMIVRNDFSEREINARPILLVGGNNLHGSHVCGVCGIYCHVFQRISGSGKHEVPRFLRVLINAYLDAFQLSYLSGESHECVSKLSCNLLTHLIRPFEFESYDMFYHDFMILGKYVRERQPPCHQ